MGIMAGLNYYSWVLN